MTSSTPVTALAIIGLLLSAMGGILAYAAKLISDLRTDNRDLQNKMLDRAIPALEANAAATTAMVQMTQSLAARAFAQQPGPPPSGPL